MPAAWDLSDFYLSAMLEAMLNVIATGGDLTMALYKNDYAPVPGSELADFTEADFPGYVSQLIGSTDFGAPTVTDHVASSVSGVVLTFVGDPGTWTPQTIYGYFVTDWNSDYFFAEKFSVPIDMSPDGEIRVTPRLRHQNLPV